jgi:hypothetical protein
MKTTSELMNLPAIDLETDGGIYADLAAPAQRQLSGELRD